jgi:transcriptional regulator with XRE-family HTH domain
LTTDNNYPRPAVHEILDDLKNTSADGTSAPTEDDAVGDKLLSLITSAPADSAAAAAVDEIAHAASPPVPADRRARLLDTVDRALAKRRRDSGPIQAILLRRRQEAGTTLEEVASKIADLAGGAPEPAALDRIESGQTPVRDSFAIVADWAVVAGIPRSVAVEGFATALRSANPDPFLAAAGSPQEALLSENDKEIVSDFIARYDSTSGTATTKGNR